MSETTRAWPAGARRALDSTQRGVLRVIGGPGTGKTQLLVDAAAAHVAAGVNPGSILLLTAAGRVGDRLRGALTAAVLSARPSRRAGVPVAVRESLVRTVPGYAFAVLRLAAERAELPPPRLVTAAEQDAAIRELLDGQAAEHPDAWPPALRAALTTRGFAAELRELLARCAERGVDPAELIRLGRRAGRPEWVSAGHFAREYEQVMLLRSAVGTAAPRASMPALSHAELVGAALEVFAAQADVLRVQHERIRLLLVDDAQQLDPQSARLVQVLTAGVPRTVIAGDPSQAVFGFRGATAEAFGGLYGEGTGQQGLPPARTAVLTESHRCSPAVARAVNGIAARLPGPGPTGLDVADDGGGSVTVCRAETRRAQDELIADVLRRAHLIDGVPWSRMAVIVRSIPRIGVRLPQTLAAAGVPVSPTSPRGPLAEQPAVAALLTVLEATVEGLDPRRARTLLTGPIGRFDPVSLRQLCRLLPRSGPRGDADLVAALTDATVALPAAHAPRVRRVRDVLQAAAEAHAAGSDPRHTLWRAWDRSGLQQRWLAASRRDGAGAVQAGRDLDAVTALFDIAEQYAARTAAASTTGLIDYVISTGIATPAPGPAVRSDTVDVISAHGALGSEFDLVVIAGLQDGLWPNTTPRGGVLDTQRLLDLIGGVGSRASVRAPVLAEERRLLVAAMGRARHRLVVTAVDGEAGGDEARGDSGLASEFFDELAGYATTDPVGHRQPSGRHVPVLSIPAVVAGLRRVVCSDRATSGETDSAAHHLARLARSGVRGADPAEWHGMLPVSSDDSWLPADAPVRLSPSSAQHLMQCPLRWFGERFIDGRTGNLSATLGSLLHALVAQPGADAAASLAELDRLWGSLPFESGWHSTNERDRYRQMLQAFHTWRSATREELTETGVEIDLHGERGAGIIAGVQLRGRIDRVERDRDGRLVVVDVKTGKAVPSQAEAQRNAQLAMYQLAARAGAVAGDEPGEAAPAEPGGARLVFLGKPAAGGATERRQDPLTAEAAGAWAATVAEAAGEVRGPTFTARINEGCRTCPIRPICPVHADEDRP